MKRRWSRLSIKALIMLWYTTVLMIVLAMNGIIIFAFVLNRRYADLDRQLKEDMEFTEQMLETSHRDQLIWRADSHHDDDEDARFGIMVEVWGPKGNLLLRRDSPGAGKLPDHIPSGMTRPSFSSVTTSHGIPVRVLIRPYSINGLPVIISVARSEENIKREMSQILFVILLAFPFATGFAGIVSGIGGHRCRPGDSPETP